MKKTIIFMALAILSLSCAKEIELNNENAQPSHKADIREVTITASSEQVETKTYFDKSNGALTWTTNESDLAVYDGTDLQSFTYEGATDGKASFTGTADVATATWTAVHPASHASLDGGKVYVTFPCVQEARDAGGMKADMNTVAGQVTHDGSGNIEDCVLKNVGGLLKLTVAKTGIKTITVSSRGEHALTGKAELSFDGSGNPVLTPVPTKYETFVTLKASNLSTGLAAGEYFVSVFPAAMSNGLLIDMENIDGTVASIKTSTAANVSRNSDLEFSGFDTGANWYTPAETTLTLEFKTNTWPFDEAISSSNAENGAWKGEGEHVMTLTADNSIKFYVHATNMFTAKSGTNGMRLGWTVGDYILFPAIPGKSLTKVVIKHSVADTSHPAIMTRGGNEVVDGGDAKGDVAANDVSTWNLSATAHNMQYRYQITKGSTSMIGSIELTYSSKPSAAPPVANTITIDMQFYDASENKALNPFTPVSSATAFDTSGGIIDYSSSSSSGTYQINGTSYNVTFSGGRVRILNGTDKHGLGMASNACMLLPTIPGYRITNIKTGYAGQADSSGKLPNRSIYLSPGTSSTDAIWSKTFKDYTFAAFPTVDEDITGAAASTDYYIFIPSGWFYMPYLTITYTEVSSPAPAPAPAPAQLLDGGVTIL